MTRLCYMITARRQTQLTGLAACTLFRLPLWLVVGVSTRAPEDSPAEGLFEPGSIITPCSVVY